MSRWSEYYYYGPACPKAVKDGIKTKKQRGDIGETWWSKRWIAVLQSFDMGARLSRGRSYARRGQVISIEIKPGMVTAKVQGTRRKPYSIKIELGPLSQKDWNKVTDTMASQAIFAAKLLAGEMPPNIEEAFSRTKLSLFPVSGNDLKTNCSCPDWANPCKHIAAVYYLLAEQFDEDPFLIFKLRGRTKEEIMEVLRQKRVVTSPEESRSLSVSPGLEHNGHVPPLEKCLDTFWEMAEPLDSFRVNPARPEVNNAILKRLGEGPFIIGKRNIASLLTRAYTAAGAAALQKASSGR